jgi:hypothetical protein
MRYCLAVKKFLKTIPTWLTTHPVCELTAVIGKMTQKGGGRYQRGRFVEPSTSLFLVRLEHAFCNNLQYGIYAIRESDLPKRLEFPIDELGLHPVVRHAALTRTVLNKKKTHDGRERPPGGRSQLASF